MQAIILAGGLGTRLRSVVSDRPKPMALVEGKPFLEYVLQGLKKSGIDDIIFAVGYKGGMVEEYFGDGSRFGIRARYAYEEELLGTAGTINGGVYLMKRALLDEIPEGKVSLENECIPRWMQEGRRLGGIVNGGYFIDIGVPEDYFRFQEDVRKGDITW